MGVVNRYIQYTFTPLKSVGLKVMHISYSPHLATTIGTSYLVTKWNHSPCLPSYFTFPLLYKLKKFVNVKIDCKVTFHHHRNYKQLLNEAIAKQGLHSRDNIYCFYELINGKCFCCLIFPPQDSRNPSSILTVSSSLPQLDQGCLPGFLPLKSESDYDLPFTLAHNRPPISSSFPSNLHVMPAKRATPNGC